MLEQVLVTPAFQRNVVIIRHPVKTVDDIALLKQQIGQVKADEAGSAGNQDALKGGRVQTD
jgi:hypothetical protein